MALRYAVATGNWSNTATWDGGTLPTSADDVFSNGFTVTINGTFTVLSIRNTSNTTPTIASGGQFIFANGGNLTCTAAQAIFVGSTTPPLEMTLNSPNTATFNGNVLTLANTNSYIAIRHSGTGTLNLNGNYSRGGAAGFNLSNFLINCTNSGTLNIVGDLSNSVTGAPNLSMATLNITAATIVNITGNVTAGSATTYFGATIYTSGASNITITGSVSTNNGNDIAIVSASTLNIIGNITATGAQPAIYNITNICTINATGTITGSSSASAIYSAIIQSTAYNTGTIVRVNGNVINNGNIMAVYAPLVTLDAASPSWTFQKNAGGNVILYAFGLPNQSDVRFGVVYGSLSDRTGTLRVPSAANVLSGVLVDNTTGTLLMTPAQFWNYLISSGFTANSIGDRLQNAATVATTGGQIASYNI